ncbi:hypothetical protein [Aliamphritea hakodatensis]|uniref:hypothetical protein n=1 Tax=Aliamphritea hakodatensis TaxID=2895352 RepID=UPI0022FD4146|nr:hypothetical protein [Aliamphritea hakodatensis]
MSLSKNKLALIIGIPLLLILLGIGGYMLYTILTAQTAENNKSLQSFGDSVMPGDSRYDLEGEDAHLAPSIDTNPNLSPNQKIIAKLRSERRKMSLEIDNLQAEVITLQAQVELLEEYKRTNERYAPYSLDEEISLIHTRIKQLLAGHAETRRFNRRQIESMSAAAAQEYRRFITINKLALDQDQIDNVVNEHLPAYAFCIGNGVDIAANNKEEEQMAVEFFKTRNEALMPAGLLNDLKVVSKPCRENLYTRLAYLTN